MYLNPPPQESNLLMEKGRIIRVRNEYPHITMELVDGSRRDYHLPESLQGMYVGIWPRLSRDMTDNLGKVRGCQAELQVDHLRYVLLPVVPRVWGVQCKQHPISFQQVLTHYRSRSGFTGGSWVVVFASVVMISAALRRDFNDRKKQVHP